MLPGDLQRISRAVVGKIKDVLPRVVAAEGQRHFEESWDNQGFTDRNLVKWRRRKAPKKTTKGGKVSANYAKWRTKDAGRGILISHQTDTKGTHLKDTIKTTVTKEQVIFSSDKEYAEVHNEGGKSGRGSGFTMPRRQFMGSSKVLDKKIEKKMGKQILNYLKHFKP